MLDLLEQALQGSAADQTELVVQDELTAVTRFANSEIHQNVVQENRRLSVRVVVTGGRSARLFTNRLDLSSIRATIDSAVTLARLQPANPKFPGLPPPSPAPRVSPPPPPSTARSRAAAVRFIVDSVAEAASRASLPLQCFGTYKDNSGTLTIVNSLGLRAAAPFTYVYLKALVDSGLGTGFSDSLGASSSQLDPGAIARTAIEKCLLNRDQVELPPGDYVTVLEPDAVADLIRFPVLTGMGARQVQEGRSFMSGRLGERVTGSNVSIWDDPLDPRCLPLPIDYEGCPARRVDLIREGIAVGPVHDHVTASEEGTTSTGHASSPFEGETEGNPYPNHVIMSSGSTSLAELITGVARGLLVTRFHYTHCPDPRRVVATGTTRDGTFLIERGKVARAVRNMRFMQSILDLLETVEDSGAPKLCQDWWAANGMDTTNYFLPALRVGRCSFTGVTSY